MRSTEHKLALHLNGIKIYNQTFIIITIYVLILQRLQLAFEFTLQLELQFCAPN